MLLVAMRSMEQSQNRLMIWVLCKCSSGSTSATNMYCFTLSNMASHSSASSSSNCSGRLASITSVCSNSNRSNGEASNCRAKVLATSKCGHKLLTHFSSYIRLELPMAYVSRPTALSLPASASGGRSKRLRNAGGCSRSTVTNIARRSGYSGKRCTSADSPTCNTFFELLTTKSRLMTASRLITASSVDTAASSEGGSGTLLLALWSSISSPMGRSWRSANESLLTSWAARSSSCA
mmetsp:Transcript_65157/g.210084  ORF Transcript_65157/g.210084 Transcript_65157/m.210084 type:complete len:236 (-) Transcript_65157:477-1184(-)